MSKATMALMDVTLVEADIVAPLVVASQHRLWRRTHWDGTKDNDAVTNIFLYRPRMMSERSLKKLSFGKRNQQFGISHHRSL